MEGKYICFAEKIMEKYGRKEAMVNTYSPEGREIYELINCVERWLLPGLSHAKIEYKDKDGNLVVKHNYADISVGIITDEFIEMIFHRTEGLAFNIRKEYFAERKLFMELIKSELKGKSNRNKKPLPATFRGKSLNPNKLRAMTFEEIEEFFNEHDGKKYNIPKNYFESKKIFMDKLRLKSKKNLDPEDYECMISKKDLEYPEEFKKIRLEEYTEVNVRREMDKFAIKFLIELYDKNCEKYKDEIFEMYRKYPILKSEEGLREIESFYGLHKLKAAAKAGLSNDDSDEELDEYNPVEATASMFERANLRPDRKILHVEGTEQKLIKNYGEMEKDKVTYKYSVLVVGGQFWSVRHPLYDQWIKDLDLTNEGFTGPFNRKLTGTYCSLFRSDPGSCGRFQDAEEVKTGNWMANPPFTESICEMAADVCLHKMTGNFAFVAPTWPDADYYVHLSAITPPVQAIGITYVKPNEEQFKADSVKLTIWKLERIKKEAKEAETK